MKKIVLFLMFSMFLFAQDSPYSLGKFQSVLNSAKYQARYSKYNPRWSTKYANFKYFANRYFYLMDNKYLTFEMCEKENVKRRSELRFKEDWQVTNESAKILEASVKLFPLNEIREFTFLQIHADSTLKDRSTIDKPLLRIVWDKELKGLRNHIWAIIRVSGDPLEQVYLKIDLGKTPKDFFNVKLVVKNSKMSIWIDGNKKINDFNVDYWNKYYNYFKAGIYLQDVGCAKILFDKLKVR